MPSPRPDSLALLSHSSESRPLEDKQSLVAVYKLRSCISRQKPCCRPCGSH